MTIVHAMGDTCPIPVVKTRKAIQELGGAGQVLVEVDNEIAVQNLGKLAQQKGYGTTCNKISDREFHVILTVGDGAPAPTVDEGFTCIPCGTGGAVVFITSDKMGTGNDALGAVLMKGIFYAFTQQDNLPATIVFYNGGAQLTKEGSPVLADLQALEAQGVEILTCGTCLNYYQLPAQPPVGGVTNLYAIAEFVTRGSKVVTL